jgi:hypothetical protein
MWWIGGEGDDLLGLACSLSKKMILNNKCWRVERKGEGKGG